MYELDFLRSGAGNHAQVLRSAQGNSRCPQPSARKTETSNVICAAVTDDYCSSPTAGAVSSQSVKQSTKSLTSAQSTSRTCSIKLGDGPCTSHPVLYDRLLVYLTSPAATSSSFAIVSLSCHNGRLFCSASSRSLLHFFYTTPIL